MWRARPLDCWPAVQRQLSASEHFSFKGWNDETVYGYVVKPYGFEPGKRFPIAFVVHDLDQPFPRMFANQTAHEGPVDLFLSLHEARAWIATIQNAPPSDDPDRQGTVIRGTRARDYTTRELLH